MTDSHHTSKNDTATMAQMTVSPVRIGVLRG